MQLGNAGGAGFGLASAASWGAGDFLGGVAAKRDHVLPVVTGAHLVGAVGFTALALLRQEAVPPAANLWWCALAGLFGAIGLLALYRALAAGRMGLAAPVSGVLSAAVPVLAGLFLDNPPRPAQMIGFAIALVAVWLIAKSSDAGPLAAAARSGLALPVLAGLGFGCFILIIGRFSAGAVFWPLVASRAASLLALSSVAAATRQRPWPTAAAWPIVAAAGAFDAGGNGFLVVASQAGRLDVAAVLSSLYPAGTVLLAWGVLRERITRAQLAGLVAALVAIALISA